MLDFKVSYTKHFWYTAHTSYKGKDEMAIWQYQCEIVPENVLGNLSHATRELMDNENWSFNDLQLNDSLKEELSSILPPAESWHKELSIWGDLTSDCIEVWFEDDYVSSISCRFDTHSPSMDFVKAICQLAKRLQCKLIYQRSLNVLEADPPIVFNAIINSINRKVLEDPEKMLPKLAAEVKQDEEY